MKKFMGYLLAVFLVVTKIVVDLVTKCYLQLGVDVVLFKAVVTMYL